MARSRAEALNSWAALGAIVSLRWLGSLGCRLLSLGRYAIRHLFYVPTLISLVRIPLAVLFPFTLERPVLSLVILVSAGASDVIDGFIARRFNLTTPTGAVADGATDKIFVATVLITLLVVRRLAMTDIILLGTREIIELPYVLWLLVSVKARASRIDDRANVFGKIATLLQFVVIAFVLLRSELQRTPVWTTAIVGVAAGLSYWRRASRALSKS